MAAIVNSIYRVLPSAQALAAEAANHVKAVIEKAVAERGRCCIALSGGNTPKLLFNYLSQPAFACLPWSRVVLFWSDERFVPHSHDDSNYRTAKILLLNQLPVSPISFPVNTGASSPQAAAVEYENTMRKLVSPHGAEVFPRFDCILLGIGADGHTASLFPGDKALAEKEAWVTVGQAPNKSYRITLTLPVINAARQVIFMASGSDKAEVVSTIICGQSPALPAAMVQAEAVTWLLDAAAAASLPENKTGK